MRNPAFNRLIEEVLALHNDKNHDYAEDADPMSNFRRAERFGVEAWRGILIRMSDKWSRIEQLTSGKTPKNESLRDSLIDNAVYSLLAVLLLDEQNKGANDAAYMRITDLGTGAARTHTDTFAGVASSYAQHVTSGFRLCPHGRPGDGSCAPGCEQQVADRIGF